MVLMVTQMSMRTATTMGDLFGESSGDDDEAAGEEPKAPEPAVAPVGRLLLNVEVNGENFTEKNYFKIKPTTRLQKLFHVFSLRQSIPLAALRFFLDFSRVSGDQTPADLDMEDGDQLDVKIMSDSQADIEIHLKTLEAGNDRSTKAKKEAARALATLTWNSSTSPRSRRGYKPSKPRRRRASAGARRSASDTASCATSARGKSPSIRAVTSCVARNAACACRRARYVVVP